MNTINKQKFLIIYHVNCDDGFGSYWACQHWLKEAYPDCTINTFEGVYNAGFDSSLYNKDTILFILDFSFSPEYMIYLCDYFNKVIWIDHHKSAIEAWDSYINTLENAELSIPANFIDVLSRDNTSSGCTLTWEFMCLNYGNPAGHHLSVPEFLEYIQDYDLYTFRHFFATKQFKAGLNSMERSIELWDGFLKPVNIDSCCRQGQAILTYKDQIIKNIIKMGAKTVVIDGISGIGCNAPYEFRDEIGEILANQSHSFGLTWFEQEDGSTKFSLRSIKVLMNDQDISFDVAAIAERFGGGGHRTAAGFKLLPSIKKGADVQIWSHGGKEIPIG